MTRWTDIIVGEGFSMGLFSSSAYSVKRKETIEVQRECANNRVFRLLFDFFFEQKYGGGEALLTRWFVTS